MSFMFHTSKFTGDISNWDVGNVIDMGEMFYSSVFNGDIS
jgi:surface protein